MAQMTATKVENMQGIVDFANGLKCLDCSSQIRERSSLALVDLARWWLEDVGAIKGCKTTVEARASQKYPKCGGAVTFYIEMSGRKAAIPVIQVTLQHEAASVHETILVPHALFMKAVADAPGMDAAEPLLEAFEKMLEKFRNWGDKTKSIPLKCMNLDLIGRPIRESFREILEALMAPCAA